MYYLIYNSFQLFILSLIIEHTRNSFSIRDWNGIISFEISGSVIPCLNMGFGIWMLFFLYFFLDNQSDFQCNSNFVNFTLKVLIVSFSQLRGIFPFKILMLGWSLRTHDHKELFRSTIGPLFRALWIFKVFSQKVLNLMTWRVRCLPRFK